MKRSLTLKNTGLVGLLFLGMALWSCSDSTSFSEEGIDGSVPARSGKAQGPMLQEALFTIVDRPQLSPEQQRMLSIIQQRPTTKEVHIARLANTPAALLEKGRAVVMNISPGKQFVAVGDTLTRRGPADISWAGPLQDEWGWAQLVLTGKGITGWLRKDSLLFKFEPLGGGLQALIYIDRNIKFSDQPIGYPSSGALIDTARVWNNDRQDSTPDEQGEQFNVNTHQEPEPGAVNIGLLVVYTPAAANAAGDINGLIQIAIDETNQSYDNSQINAHTYLAHSAQVNYDETGRTHPQHVQFLQGTSDGEMDNVHSLRTQHLADVVVLIVNDIDADGTVGFAAEILASSTTAFASVHYGVATGDFVFGHEIGHLQGARHSNDLDTSPFPYGHGFDDPNGTWQTVMATPGSCPACDRIPFWSNPNVNHPNTGQAMGTSDFNDNARVLNETKWDIRDFRTLPAPQSLSITNPNSFGNNPHISWSGVTGAETYNLYRCITETGFAFPSCYQLLAGGITITEWSDWQVTISTSCTKEAFYQVTAQNFTGESDFSPHTSVCVQTF